jgi:hypothetical protein
MSQKHMYYLCEGQLERQGRWRWMIDALELKRLRIASRRCQSSSLQRAIWPKGIATSSRSIHPFLSEYQFKASSENCALRFPGEVTSQSPLLHKSKAKAFRNRKRSQIGWSTALICT